MTIPKTTTRRAAAPQNAGERDAVAELLSANESILTPALVAALSGCTLEIARAVVQALKSKPAIAPLQNQTLLATARAIRAQAEKAEIKLLCASPDAKKCPPSVRTALPYLPSARAVRAVIAKSKRSSSGSPLAEVKAAKPGSSLRETAEKMGTLRPRGGTRTPSEIRAARAARGGK